MADTDAPFIVLLIAIRLSAVVRIGSLTALNIQLLEPLAQGTSRFEKLLAPPKIHWPPIFSNDVSPDKTVVDIIFFSNNDPLKPNVEALVNQIINLRTLVKVNYHNSAVHDR